jgi:serine protease Do
MSKKQMPLINSADIIVHIATPYSIGSGFYLQSYDIIVTNEHIVRGNKDVVIAGSTFEKQMVEILYLDTVFDLAFISPPSRHKMLDVSLADVDGLNIGDDVFAIETQTKSLIKGITTDVDYLHEDLSYILHDVNMNPVHNGSPLFKSDGMIIGINTFNILKGKIVGQSLKSFFLSTCLKEFKEGKGCKGVRCTNCKKVIFEDSDESKSLCGFCSASYFKISNIRPYEPKGICITVESLIERLGYEVSLTRKGPNNWCIKKGSVDVCISYYEKTGLLVGDVYMCTVPENSVSEIYEFLLKQNYILDGLTFSIRNEDIILSLLVYDQFINVDTIFTLFTHLLQTSDKYDNVLIESYGGRRKILSM